MRDQVTALLADLVPSPTPAARIVIPPAPTPVLADTPRAPAPEHLIPATLGFIPPHATDRIAGAEVSVGFGVHAVMGMTDRSRVASISGVADVQRRTADGLQVGGAVAIAGEEVRGAQIGGAATLTRRLRGLQVGGAAAAVGAVDVFAGAAANVYITHEMDESANAPSRDGAAGYQRRRRARRDLAERLCGSPRARPIARAWYETAMSRIYRQLPTKGTRLAIAYSGGLDTRCAVAWLAEQGMAVYAYTADLAQPDEANPADIPPTALAHGAKHARLLDVREGLAREGLIAIQCGAFHLSVGGKKYFNTTPLGRAVTTTAIVRAMVEDGVHVFGDGSTHKGNDIQRFYRYGILVDPTLKIYKPWLDAAFVKAFGGRTEMSQYLASIGKPYKVGVEKAYSTDANLLGATHEAKDLERLDTGMRIVEPIMGVAHWRPDVAIAAEEVTIGFEQGRPTTINGKRYESPLAALVEANAIGGRHGLGMSDQIENRVIDAKSRGIYEAPGMALLHIAYERLLSAIHNENTLDLYATLGRRLGRLLYEGKWFDPEACLLKDGLTRWVAPSVTGEVTLELRRGDDYTIVATRAEYMSYGPDKLSMERVAEPAFTPEDRIGALELQNLSVGDNRDLLLHHLSSLRALGPGTDPLGRLLGEALPDE